MLTSLREVCAALFDEWREAGMTHATTEGANRARLDKKHGIYDDNVPRDIIPMYGEAYKRGYCYGWNTEDDEPDF